MADDLTALNEIWRQVLSDEVKAWVIFKNGTCVVCRDSEKDPSAVVVESANQFIEKARRDRFAN